MPGDLDRVRVLLPHWIEHNEEHAQEFRQWADKVRATGSEGAASAMVAAAEAMEKVNEELRAALAALG